MSAERGRIVGTGIDGPLPGGTANRGRVVRVGDTVHRPRGVHTRAVHALLDHLVRRGFTKAPRVVTADDRSEVLTYLEGTAATEPLADWALRDDAVFGVGQLLHELHEHCAGFDSTGLVWQRPVPVRWRGPLITHNDVNPANVIFRAGAPAALIDFDLAAPASAGWDLAVTACFWAPLRSAGDIADSRQGNVRRRFRALLDGYEAPAGLRYDAAEATVEANAWIAAIIEDASRRGHPAFGRLWAAQSQMYARADAWLRRNQLHLADAVR
ncbi:phosphotransferase [uncultured Jatrophihabitans sp.]|uniref:phosphotransferase n=1 Tax=uncultured Jatrophihabitans sp. TaxID=1610747 RepID=UPI0035C99576